MKKQNPQQRGTRFHSFPKWGSAAVILNTYVPHLPTFLRIQIAPINDIVNKNRLFIHYTVCLCSSISTCIFPHTNCTYKRYLAPKRGSMIIIFNVNNPHLDHILLRIQIARSSINLTVTRNAISLYPLFIWTILYIYRYIKKDLDWLALDSLSPLGGP